MEGLLTIKEYAKQRGVSYEAVRKQISRYQEELAGHVVRQQRLVYLDMDAMVFLDAHRQPRTVIVEPEEEEVKAERESLRAQIQSLQEELLRQQKQVIDLQKEKMDLIEDQAKYQLLLEAKDELTKELEDVTKARAQAEVEIGRIEEKLRNTEEELSRFRKTFFGLYVRK